jgi:hypothetical protein
MSKVIIAGSRDLTNPKLVDMAVAESSFDVTEVVSGGAVGVDSNAVIWAEQVDIPVTKFEPDWNNLTHRDAIVRTNKWGQKYDARAGLRRNQLMAVYADALIAIWDGHSKGTAHMIKTAKRRDLEIYVYRTDNPELSGHVEYETKSEFYGRIIEKVSNVTDAEIDAARSSQGGWTREQLAEWGVSWPPPRGWRKRLTRQERRNLKAATCRR